MKKFSMILMFLGFSIFMFCFSSVHATPLPFQEADLGIPYVQFDGGGHIDYTWGGTSGNFSFSNTKDQKIYYNTSGSTDSFDNLTFESPLIDNFVTTFALSFNVNAQGQLLDEQNNSEMEEYVSEGEVTLFNGSGKTYTPNDVLLVGDVIGFYWDVLGGNTVDFAVVVDDVWGKFVDFEGWDSNLPTGIIIHTSFTAIDDFVWTDDWVSLKVEGKKAPVPEPATMLLFGTGLIGLAGLGRKKFFKKG